MPKQGFSDKVLMTAIIAIAAIECVALAHGVNGKMLALSMAVIGGIVGWNSKGLKIKLEGVRLDDGRREK